MKEREEERERKVGQTIICLFGWLVRFLFVFILLLLLKRENVEMIKTEPLSIWISLFVPLISPTGNSDSKRTQGYMCLYTLLFFSLDSSFWNQRAVTLRQGLFLT